MLGQDRDGSDEVGTVSDLGGGAADHFHREKDEPERKEELTDTAEEIAGEELEADEAEDEEDGRVAVDVEGEELDGDRDADVCAEHDCEHAFGGDAAGAHHVQAQEGDGRRGGCDAGDGTASPESAPAGAGGAL